MFDLTKQERVVLIFLGLSILGGSVLHYSFKKNPSLLYAISILENDKVYNRLDINKAKVNELVALPFIGPALAARIVNYRQENGYFTTLEELKDIPGIGHNGYIAIVKYLKISSKKIQ